MRCGVFVCAVLISVQVYFGRADRTLRHAASVLFCDTSPLFTCHTRTHTHRPNDRNMVQAVRNPPGAGSHSAIPLYLSPILFISVRLFISLCLCLSASAYFFLRFTSKQQVSSLDSFVSLPPPSQRPTVYLFSTFSGGKFLKAWMQTHTRGHILINIVFSFF